jgi:hypothetical protein
MDKEARANTWALLEGKELEKFFRKKSEFSATFFLWSVQVEDDELLDLAD